MKKVLLSGLLISTALFQAQTWTPQNSGFPAAGTGVTAFSIVDANNAWAFGSDGTQAANYQVYTRTTNAGATWTAGNISIGNTTLLISDIAAVSGTTAFVAATRSAGGSGGGIWKTTDSGATWAKQTTATYNVSTSFPNVVYFFDANTGFTMGDPDTSLVFELYTTVNGGTTWTKVPAANIPAARSDEFGYVHNRATVGNTIWFGTSIGNVYKSNNKGLNWTVSATPVSDFGGLAASASLTLKDANTGWIVDQDAQLYRTVNAGVNWTAVTATGPIYNAGIAFVPGTANTLVSYGSRGATNGSSISTDGGTTWTALDTIQKSAVAAFNGGTVYSGGFTSAAGGGMFKLSAILATSEGASAKQAVSIYPNPTQGNVTVSSKSSVEAVQVLDMTGKVVKNFSKISQLDLSSLQSGVYMLKVTLADGSSSVTKVVRK